MASLHPWVVHLRLLLAIRVQVPPRRRLLVQRRKPQGLFVFLKKVINLGEVNDVECGRKKRQRVRVDLPEFRDLNRKWRVLFLSVCDQQIAYGEKPRAVVTQSRQDPTRNHGDLIGSVGGFFPVGLVFASEPFHFRKEDLEQDEERLHVDPLEEEARIGRLFCWWD